MKRSFDLIVSLVIFICLFPVFLIFAFLVKLKLGSPIIFKQLRPGLNAKPFYLYKLRTMTDQRDSNGKVLPDYLRITSFGKFLRKYSLDEYPQLLNVIKGDISLVGPRPLLMEYLPLYTKEQSKRHQVKPGITGWAQINGRNAITWEEKFELDVWYVNNRSFLLDMKILFLTVYKVAVSEGINQPGQVTMESFKGSNSTIGRGHG
ncbi:sugar transferase [Bacillus sp. ISL-40]|uniref:sugar transferase n=1 Tax=unclassified Bacillus (in: firmicutes) TaxID=185979 RepID=UPI001BE69D47|nr:MULTISPECIES: sugar transferase [unclassified Bacillus (in: firmicutes)]MBT2699458.1 sugar transferase [Bacillus sp. ISL-40]MBT2721988.1 sugar transferase [Bacillus sp. ISL-46]MBT2741663.1 sugar transferase [Bacillus sp. ISL-77]